MKAININERDRRARQADYSNTTELRKAMDADADSSNWNYYPALEAYFGVCFEEEDKNKNSVVMRNLPNTYSAWGKTRRAYATLILSEAGTFPIKAKTLYD